MTFTSSSNLVRAFVSQRASLFSRSVSNIKKPGPAPPQLSAKEQQEWQALQKDAQEKSQQVYFHPDVRKKLRPDFEGDTNPDTGEVNGPKNNPLRHGDYSYGGRVTDF